jgi:DNA-binding MarR family transcriptional regulator
MGVSVMSNDTKNKGVVLRGLQETLADIYRLSGELTLTQMRVLVYVIRREKVTGSDICKALDLSRPTVSRSIATLADEKISRRDMDPIGFLRIEHDPLDRRVKYAVLTEKGKALGHRIVELFNP